MRRCVSLNQNSYSKVVVVWKEDPITNLKEDWSLNSSVSLTVYLMVAWRVDLTQVLGFGCIQGVFRIYRQMSLMLWVCFVGLRTAVVCEIGGFWTNLCFRDYCLYDDGDDCCYDDCYDHDDDGDCCGLMNLRKIYGVMNDDAEIASNSEIDQLCSYLLMVLMRKIFVSLPEANRIDLFSMAPIIIELQLLSNIFQILCLDL